MLLDLLEEGARGTGVMRVLPDEPDAIPTSEVWRRSEHVADALSQVSERGGAVAALLTASSDCIATIAGVWRSGLTLASLPLPGRGMPLDEYQSQIETMCAMVDATALLIDATYLAILPEMPIRVISFQQCVEGGPPGRRADQGSLVQFTSGSTGRPKGVELSLMAVAENIISTIEVVQPLPDDVICAWLPLSHDMGLIGLCLTSWVSGAPRWAGTGQACYIKPETFLANPAIWLEACTAYRATHTAAPNFGLEIAGRLLARQPDVDLTSLRICVTGAEAVRPSTLRNFAAAAAPRGFASMAFSPAYGLAEATLGVTMVRPEDHWTSIRADANALAEGCWLEADDDNSVELVSNGRPLGQTEIRVSDETSGDVGEIEVSSPSLLTRYVGVEAQPLEGGWLKTGDLGYVKNGELYVTGRKDDLIIVAGRNLFASEIEVVAEQHPAVRAGNCVAVPNDAGRYAIVAELNRTSTTDAAELRQAANSIRSRVAARFPAPAEIVFVSPGSITKTPSGKVQRHRVHAAYTKDALAVETRVAFGRQSRADDGARDGSPGNF